jgi:hypothetical protein
MKTMKIKTLTLIGILVMSFGLMGCGDDKRKKAQGPTVPFVPIPPGGGPFVPGGTGPGQGPGANWSFGGTGDVSYVSIARFSEYTNRPMNNPQDVRININFTKTGDVSYGGTISIGYTDNGIYHEGFFTTGASEKATRYNVWFFDPDNDDERVFHAVAEDFLGGLVIVIDNYVDLGDGSGIETASGSIWFKNFDISVDLDDYPVYSIGPHPPTYCWFVSLGPYDCRPWPSGDGMNTYSSKNPRAGYKKLGDFDGLDLDAAFNGEF